MRSWYLTRFTLLTITVIVHFLGLGSCEWPSWLQLIRLPLSKYFYVQRRYYVTFNLGKQVGRRISLVYQTHWFYHEKMAFFQMNCMKFLTECKMTRFISRQQRQRFWRCHKWTNHILMRNNIHQFAAASPPPPATANRTASGIQTPSIDSISNKTSPTLTAGEAVPEPVRDAPVTRIRAAVVPQGLQGVNWDHRFCD